MKYYVLCPYGVVTGGPDALHQLVFYLRKNNINSSICYIGNKKKILSIPKTYQNYFNDFTLYEQIEDSSDITIVCPETHLYYIKKFKKSNILVWWLSVDFNYYHRDFLHKIKFLFLYPIKYIFNIKREKNNFKDSFIYNVLSCKYNFDHEKSNVKHLCASYYAFQYVKKRSKNQTFLLIEPISLYFLNAYHDISKCKYSRLDIILYNPKKNGYFLNLIMQKAPELHFLPIIGYTQSELVSLYLKSKVYIDFGFFPGAERMPKEAVLFGCLIITGRKGASNFYNDVMIDDKYKFNEDKDKIGEIINLIKDMLAHYEKYVPDFKVYKNHVLSLENCFESDINKIFSPK